MTEHEKCARCGAVGTDRRTLFMACFYEMMELGVPFEKLGLRGAIVEKVMGFERHPWGNADVFSNTYRGRPDLEHLDEILRVFYTLRVCKGCRGAWLDAIQHWFRAPIDNVVRWNNDQRESPQEIDRLLARVEALRVELRSVEQELDDTTKALRGEHARRRAQIAPPDNGDAS